jgi:hypothetical protein
MSLRGASRKAASGGKRRVATQSGGGVMLTLLKTAPATPLYQPASPGPGENMLYLRWDTGAPPQSLTLEETWADTGPPSTAGYFVFLNAVPSLQDAAALEKALRSVLPAPVTTGFVWAIFPSKSSSPVHTLLKTKLNASGNPCVDGDTPLTGLLGPIGVGFGDGSPVMAARKEGFITGFVVTYPPVPPARLPLGIGVTLPMAGGSVGCVQFQGLIDALDNSASGASATKALVSVSMDPLHPIDPTHPDRNRVTYTGAEYLLTIEGNSGRISPSP